MIKAPLLKRLTLLAPLFVNDTEPVMLLPVLLSVNTPALPIKLAVPALAVCIMESPLT